MAMRMHYQEDRWHQTIVTRTWQESVLWTYLAADASTVYEQIVNGGSFTREVDDAVPLTSMDAAPVIF